MGKVNDDAAAATDGSNVKGQEFILTGEFTNVLYYIN
jgi:hypothetical protein